MAATAPEAPPAPPPAMEPLPPPSAPEAAPLPEPAAEEKKEEVFTITTGIGLRFGMQMQNLRDPEKLGMLSVDEIYAEPRFSGKVLDFVGWTVNLETSGKTPTGINVRAMDLVAQLDFIDEFHLWGGRMLTPVDRSNFSGPWFMSPWDYPGLFFVGSAGAYVGPRGTEEIGREVGATVWGDIGKGKFKYYFGMMDLDNAPTNTPLYSGRLQYAILGSEPGFYGSSTYYGAQDQVLAIGAAVQYQDRYVTATASDDVFGVNADILAEFNVGEAGTATLEGAYYHVDSGESAGVMPYDDFYFIVASYLLPPMGPGKLQPLFRYQGVANNDGGPDMSIIEGQVNYVMKDYFAKLSLGFTHTNLDNDIKGNQIQFGFQIQQ